MSFDLMAFDKSSAPGFYGDLMEWTTEQTKWDEDRDYNALAGTSPRLAAWFMEVKETFPPLNGEYSPSDDEAFASEEPERRLTDYSIGSSVIFAAIGWSAAKESEQLMARLAQEHDVGLYNFQTGEVICDSMVFCKMRTERHDDKFVEWKQIESEISTLDAPSRGKSQRDAAFITIFFTQNGTDDEFMQCIPKYPKQQGFFKKTFGASGTAQVAEYTVEVCTNGKIYEKLVKDKEHVSALLLDYYKTRKAPDISGWTDTEIL